MFVGVKVPKYVYLDLNHWIRLSRVHIKGKGDKLEHELYSSLLNMAKSEEVIFPLSHVHLEEISGARYDRNARINLAKTALAFTRNNFIQPISTTLVFEAKYTAIRMLSERLEGEKKVIAQTYRDYIKNRLDKYPYFPIGKGTSVLFGAVPALVDPKTNEPIENNELMGKIKKVLDDPEFLINIITSEKARKLYNLVKTDSYIPIIEHEKELSEIRKKVDRTRRKDVKMAQFFYWSGVSDIIGKQILYWSEILEIDPYYAGNIVLRNEEGEPDKKRIIQIHKSMPSAWCWFELEHYRDRHFEREVTATDIYDIKALANTFPYCDIVVCDKFYATAAKNAKLGEEYKKEITHKLAELRKLLKKKK